MLPENINVTSVQTQLNAAIKKHNGNDVTNRRHEILQPLKNMHFDYRYETLGDHTSSKTILLTLAFIGMLIIVMASINFINLSTAQAVGRSKEVGIRKVLGSSRSQLITQVMSETFLIVLTALLIAIVIAKIALPYLKNVASVPADISLFSMGSVIFLFAVLIVVTILSGFYPALVVSGFKPALALKSKINSANIGGLSLRRVLVVTQFAISQALIIGTIVAISQMNAVRNADLGFDKEAVLITTLPSVKESKTRMTSLKQQLLQNPNITSISLNSDEASSSNNWASNFAFNGKDDEDYPVYHKYGDEDYLKTFGLQLAAGKNFEASDTIKELMINETLVKKLGVNDPQKIIGKTLRIGGGRWVPIVGVVKDFKTNSLKVDVKPLTIAPRKDFYFTMAVKMHTANIAATAAAVQKAWEKTYPEFAYDSHFADETIEQFYKQDNQLSLLYKLFAGIAVFISCLGLYGLVSFMAVQKTKEVGVRRVLGASISNVVVMFSKEFTILIVIAFAIAAPVAWFFMHNWLQNFAYKINIGIGIFLLAIVVSLIIAWITVGYRAVKAATANPVKSLRTE